ncbi:MAG: fructosamine kinase family protein [Phormidesmis sp.]
MKQPLTDAIAAHIASHISKATHQSFEIETQRSIGGGCINQAVAVADSVRTFFVKVNRASQIAMFEAEYEGLTAMYESRTIRVPLPLGSGVFNDVAYIIMEWLPLGGSAGRHSSDDSWRRMGEQLAAMHQVTSPEGFGWHRDNTIGATPQKNGWWPDWSEFWRDRRLGPQFELAHQRNGHFPRRDELMSAIPRLLAGHSPPPALLHGDLWSGNAAITAAGEPVILDPATYYGDPETDLAMTELFGRFPASFYRAYQSAMPLREGYAQRKVLYNLYHILNHFNLFGGNYESQANRMIAQILS